MELHCLQQVQESKHMLISIEKKFFLRYLEAKGRVCLLHPAAVLCDRLPQREEEKVESNRPLD
jgi:hypothetical protein